MVDKNPWLALSTYEEQDEYRFRGREVATKQVLNLIRQNDCVVCYAMSGSGKSSLINAGVCPQLRREGYFPINIVFHSDEYKGNALPHTNSGKIDFDKIILNKILDCISKYKTDYLIQNTQNDDFDIVFEDIPELTDTPRRTDAWTYLRSKQIKINAHEEQKYTPLLIFDQFEEIFQAEWKSEFFKWLETLMNDVCPYENNTEISSRKLFKVLFSLRYEYIGDLDYWCSQRYFIPQLQKNRYYLNLLKKEEAISILSIQPSTDEAISKIKDEAEEIVTNIMSHDSDGISPIILSLIGYILYDEYSNCKELAIKDININALIVDFYHEALETCRISQEQQEVIEDALISTQGTRLRVSVLDPRLQAINIDLQIQSEENLISKHIIRIIDINNEKYIEFVHDKLVEAICEDRKECISYNNADYFDYNYRFRCYAILIISVLFLLASSFFVITKYSSFDYTRSIDKTMNVGPFAHDRLSGTIVDSIKKSSSITINHNLYSKSNRIYCYDNVLWGYEGQPIWAGNAKTITFGDIRQPINTGKNLFIEDSIQKVKILCPEILFDRIIPKNYNTVAYIPYGSKDKFRNGVLDCIAVQEMGILETLYEVIKLEMCSYYVPMFYSSIYVPLWLNMIIVFIFMLILFIWYVKKHIRYYVKLLIILQITFLFLYIVCCELYWLKVIHEINTGFIFFCFIIFVLYTSYCIYEKISDYRENKFCILFNSKRGKGYATKVRLLMINSGIPKSDILFDNNLVLNGCFNPAKAEALITSAEHQIAIVCDEDITREGKLYLSVLKRATLLHPILITENDFATLPKKHHFIRKGNMFSFPAIRYYELVNSNEKRYEFINSLYEQETPGAKGRIGCGCLLLLCLIGLIVTLCLCLS